ncbi:Response regulator receiver modulated serine phosphatase [Planctomycetales bacterium 10988]|nr:Response regulator receiver modulated serine phosphatase [Planctomycetales bacterium 10988]
MDPRSPFSSPSPEEPSTSPPASPANSGDTASTPSASAPSQENHLARQALIAHLRHELTTPINAIIEYSEILLQDAKSQEAAEFIEDLERVHQAGENLNQLVRQILQRSESEEYPLDESVRRTLKHDLRTPLNHILGYSEMLIEDAEENGWEEWLGDLQRIHESGRQMLNRLDEILNFGSAEPQKSPKSSDPDLAESLLSLDFAEEFKQPLPQGEAGKILIVDDNPTNRDLAQRRLESQGHSVSVAENGQTALEILRIQPFDVVLLDVMMPILNGFEVLRQMKADENLRHIPVIMISAFDEMDSVVQCILMGAEDYLTKPFNPTLLKARIDASLEKKRLRDREQLYLQQIEWERKRSNELLKVILPDEIVEELKARDAVQPRRLEQVAVLFADIVGFTNYCDKHPPEQVVADLQQLIVLWEEIALEHEVEKIKTIGDAFMAACGLLKPMENPVENCVRCGQDMIRAARSLPTAWRVRVGIHCGPVVAGVLGRKKYLYDLWGDTVNTASRMESHGSPGAVTLSGEAFASISSFAEGVSIGSVRVKGKGDMQLVRFKKFL